jgi:hypothetical protein
VGNPDNSIAISDSDYARRAALAEATNVLEARRGDGSRHQPDRLRQDADGPNRPAAADLRPLAVTNYALSPMFWP